MFDKILDETRYWTYKEPIGITKEQWMRLLKDGDVIREKDIQLLIEMYKCECHRATASQLAQSFNLTHHVLINRQVGSLGRRIAERLNLPAPARWWRVPFWGMGKTEEGLFYWILRPELRDAMKELRVGFPGLND